MFTSLLAIIFLLRLEKTPHFHAPCFLHFLKNTDRGSAVTSFSRNTFDEGALDENNSETT